MNGKARTEKQRGSVKETEEGREEDKMKREKEKKKKVERWAVKAHLVWFYAHPQSRQLRESRSERAATDQIEVVMRRDKVPLFQNMDMTMTPSQRKKKKRMTTF